MESARGLRGVIVATKEEGIILGEVEGIQVDPAERRITALTVRAKRGPNKHLFVKSANVEKIGEDLILVPSEYESRIKLQPKEKYGVMGRLLGEERIDDVRDAIGRVLKRQEEEGAKKKPEDGPRPRN